MLGARDRTRVYIATTTNNNIPTRHTVEQETIKSCKSNAKKRWISRRVYTARRCPLCASVTFRGGHSHCLHNAQFAIAIERNLYVTCHFVRGVFSRRCVLTDCVWTDGQSVERKRETPAGLFGGIGR